MNQITMNDATSPQSELEKFYSMVLEGFCGGILVSDAKGNIVYVNGNSKALLDRDPEYYYNKTILDLVNDGLILTSLTQAVLKEKRYLARYLSTIDGMHEFAIAKPMFDDNQELTYVVTSAFLEKTIEHINAGFVQQKKQFNALVDRLTHSNKKSEIIAESPNMKKIVSLSDRIAASDSTVLIQGESGTGKEVFARYIHDHSNRKANLFMPVNCAALSAELIESELFGYEKGAFTGASSNGKIGLFELANNGTIFLDEIGEMALPTQAKLLRVLENGEYLPVGGKKIRYSNARIIAATNRNLLELVEQKRFRSDLYYRLHIIPLTLPPLRERTDDIVPLINFFLAKYNAKYSSNKRLTTQTFNELIRYPYPGNVRELKNIIERLVLVSPNVQITTSDLHFFDTANSDSHSQMDSPTDLKTALKDYEQRYINSVLEQNDGNVADTARQLGISLSSLYAKLKNSRESA